MDKNQPEFRIGDLAFREDDRRTDITVRGHAFKIKAIFPKEQKEILRRIAIDQNGLPAMSFDATARDMFEMYATVETCLVTRPDWFKKVEDIPDIGLISDLYKEIIDWTELIQTRLKKNELGSSSP